MTADPPTDLRTLLRQAITDPGSVLARANTGGVPGEDDAEWSARAIEAVVLPTHRADVAEEIAVAVERAWSLTSHARRWAAAIARLHAVEGTQEPKPPPPIQGPDEPAYFCLPEGAASTSPAVPEPTDHRAPSGSDPLVNWALLTELSLKPHPLLNIQDDFEAQIRSIPISWTGEVFQEARSAHHLLDMAGVPHGKGYAQDLDARTYQLLAEVLALRERLGRLADWHSRETGPAGLVGDFCVDCGHVWPCDTRRMADGTYADLAEVIARDTETNLPVPDIDMPMVVRSLRVSVDVDQRIREVANVRGISVSALMRQFIETGLGAFTT